MKPALPHSLVGRPFGAGSVPFPCLAICPRPILNELSRPLNHLCGGFKPLIPSRHLHCLSSLLVTRWVTISWGAVKEPLGRGEGRGRGGGGHGAAAARAGLGQSPAAPRPPSGRRARGARAGSRPRGRDAGSRGPGHGENINVFLNWRKRGTHKPLAE